MNHLNIDRLIKIAMAVCLCALGYVIVTSMYQHITDVGDTAPAFAITTDQGLKITPTNFGGRLLILNFWASWCTPCVEEAPSLAQLPQNLAGSGVVVLGVSIDKNPKLYQSFLNRFKIPFQTARDPDSNLSADFGTFKVPETYIIDRNGKVVQKIIGTPRPPLYWSDPELLNYLKSI